ncbi:hypothetical protein KJ632_04770 [Patescibacteria group bacterium]|nr:hypothetical protein [Patescibacteria group bacterium]
MPNISKLALIKELIESAESNLRSVKQMLLDLGAPSSRDYSKSAEDLPDMTTDGNDKVVEGVFNGESMEDKNEKNYPVPANYASKSKLIPGDILKLTIKDNGNFVYKQIGPAERRNITGTLTYEDGQYKVIAEGKAYKVILASVTYFKGEVGDKVTLVVPELEDSEWGAIENILPNEE